MYRRLVHIEYTKLAKTTSSREKDFPYIMINLEAVGLRLFVCYVQP